MYVSAIIAEIEAAENQKRMLKEEKIKCEKEVESCNNMLKSLSIIDSDYINCTSKMNSSIKHLANGYIINNIGVGVNALEKRNSTLKSHHTITQNTVEKVNKHLKKLLKKLEELTLKIDNLTKLIDNLKTQLSVAIAESTVSDSSK